MYLPTENFIEAINEEYNRIQDNLKFITIRKNYHVLFDNFVSGALSNYNREYYKILKDEILDNIDNKKNYFIAIENNLGQLINSLDQAVGYLSRYSISSQFQGTQLQKVKNFQVQILDDLINQVYETILNVFLEYISLELENPNLLTLPLTSKTDFLNKHNFQIITNLIPLGIRNATSHNGVSYNDTSIIFESKVRGKPFVESVPIFEFSKKLKGLINKINSILLFFFEEINNNDLLGLDDFSLSNQVELTEVQSLQSKIMFSLPNQICQSFQVVSNTYTDYQINIEFNGSDLTKFEKINLFYFTLKKIENYNHSSLKFDLFISQKSPKSIVSFIKYTSDYIKQYSSNQLSEYDIYKHLSNNALVYGINPEDRNIKIDNFTSFEDINEEDYEIIEIEDISTEDLKRLRGRAIISIDSNPKETIIAIVNHLKNLNSYGFPSHKVKHGNVEADILFLYIYKNRYAYEAGDSSTSPTNDNFIACVQYDKNKEFPIKMDNQRKFLKFEVIDEIEYRWNPNFIKEVY